MFMWAVFSKSSRQTGSHAHYLDQDLAPEAVGGGQTARLVCLDAGKVQLVPQNLHQALCHLLLLWNTAVVLYGEDDWEPVDTHHRPSTPSGTQGLLTGR